MKIAIASDHAGFGLKSGIIRYLEKSSNEIEDFGTYDTEPVDYVDIGVPCAESVAKGNHDIGILICGTGQGMNIIANKVYGIRAALCNNQEFAKLAREHNDANVLVLAGRYTDFFEVREILDAFLHTKFSEQDRHTKRINKIKEFETQHYK
jgi:ribose 5-phosphate isomerase B